MIPGPGAQIRDRDTGLFLYIRSEHSVDQRTWVKRIVWESDPRWAHAWTPEHVDRWLASPDILLRELDEKIGCLERVRAPACGCCGKMPATYLPDPDTGDVLFKYRRTIDLEPVAVADDGLTEWRCKKHVGRNPCIIPGCAKTFALEPRKDDGWPATYSTVFVCGRHWRMAPRRMRDKVAKVRRLAKRRGWTDQLARVHSILFDRCVRVVRRGLETPAGEIQESAGPPPAALTAELERLGL